MQYQMSGVPAPKLVHQPSAPFPPETLAPSPQEPRSWRWLILLLACWPIGAGLYLWRQQGGREAARRRSKPGRHPNRGRHGRNPDPHRPPDGDHGRGTVHCPHHSPTAGPRRLPSRCRRSSRADRTPTTSCSRMRELQQLEQFPRLFESRRVSFRGHCPIDDGAVQRRQFGISGRHVAVRASPHQLIARRVLRSPPRFAGPPRRSDLPRSSLFSSGRRRWRWRRLHADPAEACQARLARPQGRV